MPLVFDKLANLPSPLYPAGAKVTKLYSEHSYLDSSKTFVILNWDSFKDAVAARAGPNLTPIKTESTTIVRPTASVEDMAGRICQFLYDKFSLEGAEDEHLHDCIYKAFQDAPGESGESGGLFSETTYSTYGRRREHHILLMAPRPEDADAFYAVLATVTVHASIHVHKGLFGMGNETRYEFTADVSAMELLVNKNYSDA